MIKGDHHEACVGQRRSRIVVTEIRTTLSMRNSDQRQRIARNSAVLRSSNDVGTRRTAAGASVHGLQTIA